MLGTAAPTTHEGSDLELIGSSNTDNLDSDVIKRAKIFVNDIRIKVIGIAAANELKVRALMRWRRGITKRQPSVGRRRECT